MFGHRLNAAAVRAELRTSAPELEWEVWPDNSAQYSSTEVFSCIGRRPASLEDNPVSAEEAGELAQRVWEQLRSAHPQLTSVAGAGQKRRRYDFSVWVVHDDGFSKVEAGDFELAPR